MKHRSNYRSLVLGCALLPLVAWAAEPAAQASTPAAASASAPPPEKDARCHRTTGSRIKSAKATSCPGAGQMTRSYSRRELETTGEIDMAEALRKLDPIFR